MPQHITGLSIVGLGGTGSALYQPVAAMLANMEDFVGDVVFCDGDAYEEKNLRNQCITPDDVERNKADACARQVARMVHPIVWDEYLEGPAKMMRWLTDQFVLQRDRTAEGKAPGVAVIFTPVDNAHARWFIFDAIEQCEKTNVLVIDPSNGTVGDDPDQVDCVSYLRVWDPDVERPIEPWPSIVAKYPKYREPTGRNPKTGCQKKAESMPQLRTSNMRAALYAYDFLERFIMDRGMPEARRYCDEHGERDYGSRLPTDEEMGQPLPMEKNDE